MRKTIGNCPIFIVVQSLTSPASKNLFIQRMPKIIYLSSFISITHTYAALLSQLQTEQTKQKHFFEIIYK